MSDYYGCKTEDKGWDVLYYFRLRNHCIYTVDNGRGKKSSMYILILKNSTFTLITVPKLTFHIRRFEGYRKLSTPQCYSSVTVIRSSLVFLLHI